MSLQSTVSQLFGAQDHPSSGFEPNPQQIEAVQRFPVPENLSQVRQFLGLASSYRRFVERFATLACPLHALTRKNAVFAWTKECQVAFESLKTKLVDAPVLAFPNFNETFLLETDACVKGLGAVLSQKQSDSCFHPVAYASRSLSAPEKNYSITELETLAVVWAIQHFHAYLYGHEVTVVTDHSAVQAVLETPSPTGKHARWWLKVFASGVGKVQIVYRPGRENTKADALSRNPVSSPEEEDGEVEVQVASVRFSPDHDISELLDEPPPVSGVPRGEFGEEQRKDSDIQKWVLYLESGVLQQKLRRLWHNPTSLLWSVGFSTLWTRQKRAVVPVQLRDGIMRDVHGGVMSGHFSGNRLFKTLSCHWWWQTMYRDCADHCKNCAECAVVSGSGRVQRPPLHPIPVQRPFQVMGGENEQNPKSHVEEACSKI